MSGSIGGIGRRSGAHSPPAARPPARAASLLSGARWVRDQLVGCGWQVEVADARKVKTVAPLAAKTDKVDARLLAELSRRELVPGLWLPSLDERALRERLPRDGMEHLWSRADATGGDCAQRDPGRKRLKQAQKRCPPLPIVARTTKR